MILTFEDIYTEIQQGLCTESASELLFIKKDVNFATQRFKSVMKRPWSRISKKTSSVADQQDYQLPKSVLRISGVDYLESTNYYPLTDISSELQWNELNSMTNSGEPYLFFPKGKNVISLFPTPSVSVTEGIRIYYEPKQSRMTSADYKTGTVAVVNGSTTLTHSGTGFTPSMVGSYFYVTDGTDGYEYMISGYTSTSVLTIDNVYEGITNPTATFVIGQVPDVPDEYLPSIIDYALGRGAIRNGDRRGGAEFLLLFQSAIEEAKDTYGTPTSNQHTPSPMDERGWHQFDIPPRGLS